MKYCLFWIALGLFVLEGRAQELVSLRTVSFEVADTSFYISQVSDDREAPLLGHLKDLNGNKVPWKLDGGASAAVQEFMDASLPHSESKQSVRIQMKALNVQESKRRMDGGIARIARAHAELVFLEKHEGTWRAVFRVRHNEDEVFDLYDRIGLLATHEKRIRAVLEYCVLAFTEYRLKKPLSNEPMHFPNDSVTSTRDSRLGHWFNVVTIRGMNSTHHWGWSVNYTGFVDSDRGFIFPYELSYEEEFVKTDLAREEGYESVTLHIIRPRFYYLYRKLVPGIYAAFSINMPIGYEQLIDQDDNQSFNFLIGAGASQGIRIIPWKKFGIVVGADFLQQYQTSKLYRTDLGFELMLGVSF